MGDRRGGLGGVGDRLVVLTAGQAAGATRCRKGAMLGRWSVLTAVAFLVLIGAAPVMGQFERAREPGESPREQADNPAPAEPRKVDWKTGTALTRAWEQPTDVLWEDRTVRDAVRRLAETQGVALFVDRRIDPETPLTLTFRDRPLGEVIEKIAQQLGGGVCRVGDVYYLGPPETVKRLPTVGEIQYELAKEHSLPQVQALTRVERLRWPMLATPRDLLQGLADSAGLSWKDLELHIPHDLWRDYDLPPMRRTEALTLLLAGFDMSYRIVNDRGSGPQLEPIPIPAQVRLTRTYPFSGNLNQAVAKIREMFPEMEVSTASRELVVAGSVEDHRDVARLLRGERVRRTVVEPGKKVYTMTQQQVPVGQVIQAIGQHLDLQVTVEEGLEEALAKRVSFSVENAELDALLTAILQESDLGYELQDGQLSIRRK